MSSRTRSRKPGVGEGESGRRGKRWRQQEPGQYSRGALQREYAIDRAMCGKRRGHPILPGVSQNRRCHCPTGGVHDSTPTCKLLTGGVHYAAQSSSVPRMTAMAMGAQAQDRRGNLSRRLEDGSPPQRQDGTRYPAGIQGEDRYGRLGREIQAWLRRPPPRLW